MTAHTMGYWGLGGTALGLVLAAAGCSSAPSSQGPADAGPSNGLTGMYVTNDDGPVQQFQFVDGSHVNVWWSECADGNPCEALATYTFDGSRLVVTDPAGNVSTLGMAGIESQTMTQSDKLRVLGTSLGGSGGTALGGGGSTSLGGGGTPIALTELEALIVAFDIDLVIEGKKPSSGSGSGLKLCSGSQHFSTSSTFPNDRTAFDFFRTKGLSAVQAAGIVGNLDQESGVNPTEYQLGGGPGRGIAQWSEGGRWNSSSGDNAESFAADGHGSVWSLTTQLEFIWYELTQRGYGFSDLKSQTTVDGAEYAFQDKFEICGTCDESERQAYAATVYKAFSKDPVRGTGGSGGGTCTQSWGSCSADGESGSCVDTAACGDSGGASTPGYCPGPSNIQCCTTPPKRSSGGEGGGASDSVATLALANVGDGACSRNSKGGQSFDSSCTGNGGEPEYWCADFASWVWAKAGYDTSGLSAAAGSFYCYGKDHGTLHSSPAVGDAVVFDYGVNGPCTANHVAIVTEVNRDGTIETVSGDWGGENGGGEAHFASTSHVVHNSPAYAGSEGTSPSTMGGMTLSAFVAPVK